MEVGSEFLHWLFGVLNNFLERASHSWFYLGHSFIDAGWQPVRGQGLRSCRRAERRQLAAGAHAITRGDRPWKSLKILQLFPGLNVIAVRRQVRLQTTDSSILLSSLRQGRCQDPLNLHSLSMA